jgi:hypothetical protein
VVRTITGLNLTRKLSDAQVDTIRTQYSGMSHVEVAELFGVSPTLVRHIRSGLKRKKRYGEKRERVRYEPLPVALLDRLDLDVWFVRRAAALLRGYAKATDKLKATGRMEEPSDEELKVNDGLDAGYVASPERQAERILARARKIAAAAAVNRPAQKPKDQADKGASERALPAPDLLFDSRR